MVVTPRQRCSVRSLIVLSICATVVLCGGYPLASGPTDFGLVIHTVWTVVIFAFSLILPVLEPDSDPRSGYAIEDFCLLLSSEDLLCFSLNWPHEA